MAVIEGGRLPFGTACSICRRNQERKNHRCNRTIHHSRCSMKPRSFRFQLRRTCNRRNAQGRRSSRRTGNSHAWQLRPAPEVWPNLRYGRRFDAAIKDLLNPRFRRPVEEKFDVDLSPYPPCIVMMGNTTGNYNEGYAHPDSKHKIITALLGFSREWRSGRDSNPRYGFTTVQRFSKPPPSAARPPLQKQTLNQTTQGCSEPPSRSRKIRG